MTIHREVTAGYARMESAAMSDATELRGLADTLKQWPGNAALEHEVRVPRCSVPYLPPLILVVGASIGSSGPWRRGLG